MRLPCPLAATPLTHPRAALIIERMFPTTHHNGSTLQRRKQGESPPSLADIVREETQDGRLIVRFLFDVMQGELEGAKLCHRLNAARQLLNLGSEDARAFVASNTRAPNRRVRSRLDPKLADIIRRETDDGGDPVRFLVDVMRGGLPDFKPHHRLSAAKELLRLLPAAQAGGFDHAPAEGHDRPAVSSGRPHPDREPVSPQQPSPSRPNASPASANHDDAGRSGPCDNGHSADHADNRAPNSGRGDERVVRLAYGDLTPTGYRPRIKKYASEEERRASQEAERAAVMEAFERSYRKKMAEKAAARGDAVEPNPDRPDTAQGSPDPPEEEDADVSWSKPGYVEEPSRWELKATDKGLDIWDTPKKRRWGTPLGTTDVRRPGV